MNRRMFLMTVAMAAGGTAAPTRLAAEGSPASPVQARQGRDMPTRVLGRTGEQVSAIGLGGYHIGLPPDEQDSITLIRRAIDRGITFLDNCWDYHRGASERRMGQALRVPAPAGAAGSWRAQGLDGAPHLPEEPPPSARAPGRWR